MNVATEQPDPRPHFQPPLPSRDAVCGSQIHTILSVIGALSPYILASYRIDADGEGTPTHIDGGAKTAAEVTFCKACDRLDRMLDDSGRWGLDTHDQLYQSILETQKSTRDLQRTQQESLLDLRRPCNRLRPNYCRGAVQGEIKCIAYYGDVTDPDSLITGIGNTPAEAAADFDQAFLTRQIQPTELALSKNENENETLDSKRTRPVEHPDDQPGVGEEPSPE